jgi:hypothetical protein
VIQAIRLAKQVAETQGWAWLDTPYATLRWRWFGPGGRWKIFSNAQALGAKVRVVLDAESGGSLDPNREMLARSSGAE